ncbi:MAG TPA: AraC family transcriptional regulator [Devosiaceae bacterium]|jgi:AraC-like DNA-binding protein
MSADPLSQILELLNARCLLSGGMVAGGAWARHFLQPDAIKFMAVAEGECWLLMESLAAPLHLDTGDVIVVNGKRPLILASDPAVQPMPATEAYDHVIDGIGYLGDRREVFILGGHVALDPARQDLLLDVLPPLIHVRGSSGEAAVLHWLLQQLVRERSMARPGAEVATAQLAQLLFVQALRAYLTTPEPIAAGGWLRALGDERIAPALQMMHADPARPWALEELAKAVAMSRTTFALRFKTVVGVAPLAYLLGWRMHLAERDLRESEVPVAALARTLGYSSESAFSNAFKRLKGVAPKRYRTDFRHAEPTGETGAVY